MLPNVIEKETLSKIKSIFEKYDIFHIWKDGSSYIVEAIPSDFPKNETFLGNSFYVVKNFKLSGFLFGIDAIEKIEKAKLIFESR